MDAALHCEIVGRADRGKGQYGGIRIPVTRPRAFKLKLSFEQPRNISAVIVEGCDSNGQRLLSWAWRVAEKYPVPSEPEYFAFVPGESTARFNVIETSAPEAVTELHVYVRIRPGSTTAIRLHKAEVAVWEE